nr:DcuS/MalK family sensor histidine kinase [Bacillus mesophilus]
MQTRIVMLILGVFVLSFFVTDFLISKRIASNIELNKIDKISYVGRMMSNSALVIEALEGKRDHNEIQTFTNKITKATDVDFIVVMDMNRIRKSHPDQTKVGKLFVGGDELNVFKGKEYVSTAKGTLGVSLRAFSPIYGTDGSQIGAVAVGILLANVNQEISYNRMIIFTGIGVGGLVGLMGALILARRIKRILFGLEPLEISQLLEERNAMLQSTREGFLAVDQYNRITVVNPEAIRLFQQAGIDEEPIGKDAEELLPGSRLRMVLKTGNAEFDQEQNISGSTWLVNRTPVILNNKVVGAISTFRDKTEVKKLAEQLTGVQMYVEALRAQTHEFMNKLHVILGMVNMGFYDELTGYVSHITKSHQEEIGFIVKLVQDPALAGFLLGKLSFAREMDAELHLSGDCIVPEPKDSRLTHELITIIGNLIDNSIHAVQDSNEKILNIEFQYEDNEDVLTIIVRDTGIGIPTNHLETIFMNGFSTKGNDRGTGLFLVRRSVERLKGSLIVDSELNKGTTFTISLPYEGKDLDDD